MKKLMITIAAVALLSGCVVMPSHTTRDQSMREETALIKGLDKFWSDCLIDGPLPIDYSNLKPSSLGDIFTGQTTFGAVGSLVVDAGAVQILAKCVFSDTNMNDIRLTARFDFGAEAGHTYTVSDGAGCLNLLDVTTDGQIVACEPFFSGPYVDLSTGDETAIVRTSYRDDCDSLRVVGAVAKAGFLLVDAGPFTVDVTCQTYIIGWRTLSFDFVAETGHTYTFMDSDKECVRLIDITFEETVIACEPY